MIQLAGQLHGLVLFGRRTERRQVPRLAAVSGYGLALHELAQAVAVALVLPEVVLHLRDLKTRLQIKYS